MLENNVFFLSVFHCKQHVFSVLNWGMLFSIRQRYKMKPIHNDISHCNYVGFVVFNTSKISRLGNCAKIIFFSDGINSMQPIHKKSPGFDILRRWLSTLPVVEVPH